MRIMGIISPQKLSWCLNNIYLIYCYEKYIKTSEKHVYVGFGVLRVFSIPYACTFRCQSLEMKALS